MPISTSTEEIGGLPGITSWALYREMRRDGIAISLEGHGGDERLRHAPLDGAGTGADRRLRSDAHDASPCWNWRLVCYAFSTPDESKAGGGYAKRLLREAMRGVLPEDVRSRRDKLGYNAPITDWLTDGLADWLWDMVNEPEFLRSELWDGRALLALARAKSESGAPWSPPEVRRATTAVTAHWWLTRWLKPRSLASHASSVSSAHSW